MLKRLLTILLFTQLMVLAACSAERQVAEQQPFAAHNVNLNQHWQFQKSEHRPAADHPAWQQISLPHTPRIEPMIVNDQWQGIAWYQKTLQRPADWQHKKIFIRFEGAMNHAEIWLNERKIGEHLGGYLPFTLDLTAVLNTGDNLLQVRLDNRDNPVSGPKPLAQLDFNTYGGLYRGVQLLVKDPLHITDEILANETAGGGIFVTYPQISRQQATLNIQTHIANHYHQSQQAVVVQQLYYQQQKVAEVRSNAVTLAANSAQHIQQQLQLNAPQLWHPQTPYLYQLHTQLYLGDQLLEQQQTRIGLRTFSFNEQHQLLINGQPAFLRGVNRHQEYPHVGYATSAQADYRDAVKIKSAGFDYVRLSHYPHSKAFMDAADELGLVVLDAILGWQYYLEDPAFRAHILQTCRDMIRRDRNHASVLAWECSLNESDMPADFIARLHQTVKQEYPGSHSAGWQQGFDLYLQARQHRQIHYETPNQPYNVSEYGDWEYYAQNAGFHQDSWADLKEEERTSRQLLRHGEARLLQQALNVQEAHNDNLTTPAFADGYWVMFDYNRGYADDLEASGVMSLYRLPKYSYYFFRSQRNPAEQSAHYPSGPMVFIASEWQPSSSATVRVFSNAEEVELWHNDQLVSRRQPQQNGYSTHLPHPPFEFNLGQFKAGTLTAKAFIGGKQVAEHSVATPGKVAGLQLTLDSSGIAPVAGVGDLVFVYAELLDAQGNPVPLNDKEIRFETEGEISVLNPEAVLTEQGKAAVLVKIGDSLQGAVIRAVATEFDVQSQPLSLER
ncbi:glycoside hydrolase family 2 TIM barrel-domain containing protein [Chromatiaceae bacterium AAb-1]|nr:glycoside hydrolase family 2 TIM barrel-domain containing protein [Chromatiaceae bacterium AAb-1]